jgi:hypothetical protein
LIMYKILFDTSSLPLVVEAEDECRLVEDCQIEVRFAAD